MKQADLDAVREASQREREHSDGPLPYPYLRDDSHRCGCDRCAADRATVMLHLPALLRYIDESLAQPRREHHDLGDID